MTKDEMRALPIETLCSMFELTGTIENLVKAGVAAVRGWTWDVIQEKEPDGFMAWLDSEDSADDRKLKEYVCQPAKSGNGKMRIKEVTDEHILFDNGSKITYDHEQDCCEHNYADFEQLEEAALSCEFPENLVFEKVDGSGFRFGGEGTYMFFISCYSVQNGYYTSDIEIYCNGNPVLILDCKMEIDY